LVKAEKYSRKVLSGNNWESARLQLRGVQLPLWASI